MLDELKNNKILISATPIILYVFLLFNGISGLDFGEHWDEFRFILPACESIESGVFLPHEYIYPSFCYYIVVVSGLIYKIVLGINDARLLISDYNFYLYIRCVFLSIASLSVVWVYLLTMKITKNYSAALFSGLIICASFEFSYHSRWAVSDCIVMQFSALCALVLFLNISRRKKIIFSSLIVGIAVGTKYTGGIIILNVIFFILIGLKFNKKNLKDTAGDFFLLLAFSIIGFVIATPGVIFENDLLVSGMILQKNIYSEGHVGHTVNSAFEHISKGSVYIALELFSGNPVISFIIFLLSAIGFTTVLIKKQWNVLYLYITMLIYIIFISKYKVMIVRNLLYILPIFAVFASIGFLYICNGLKKYKLNNALKVIMILILIYSCSDVVIAAYSIKNKSSINLAYELEKYLEKNKDKDFIFSKKVSSLLKQGIDNDSKPAENSYFVFFKNEIHYLFYEANINGRYKIVGLDDVNFDYYPVWSGADRIVVMKYSSVSDDMLDYALNGTIHKMVSDAENFTADSTGFLSAEYINDSLIKDRSGSIHFKKGGHRSDEESLSGKYSVKLDKNNPYGFECRVKLKPGSYYKFSVWRKNPTQTGLLVAGENHYYNRSYYASETDSNGWQLLSFDYFCSDSSIEELPVYVWQQDTLSTVYFDDLTIMSVEKPDTMK